MNHPSTNLSSDLQEPIPNPYKSLDGVNTYSSVFGNVAAEFVSIRICDSSSDKGNDYKHGGPGHHDFQGKLDIGSFP